jgi:hypothetical protein
MLENLGDEGEALVHQTAAVAHPRLHRVPCRDDLHGRVLLGGLVDDVATAECCTHTRDEAEVISDVTAGGLFQALSSHEEILPTRKIPHIHRGPAECRVHDSALHGQDGDQCHPSGQWPTHE